jgi:three-Cys-motif partner protein
VPDDTLWPLEPATAAKHQLYRSYLDGWWPTLLQSSWDRVTYLDAFAGPGRYKGGEEGSPVFALRGLLSHEAAGRMRLSRQRARLLFVEKRRDRFDYLEAELDRVFGPLGQLPVHVQAFRGEAGTDAERLLHESCAWGYPILAIFDSWGNVNVPFTLMRRLARNPSGEVVVTFGPNWFSRRDQLDPDELDSVFGGRQFWEPANRETRPDERWRAWLATYRAALRRAGFRYQLQFRVVPKTGQPLYLVFGSSHPKGVQVMKDAMWRVDGHDGMGFADPRTRGAPLPGQGMLLWAGPEHPELLELVHQRLQSGPASLEDLREWLVTETARWRAKDAEPAVRDLLGRGLVAVNPSGRLTKATTVTLR